MRLITSSLVAAGTVAGLAGAVVTYQSVSGSTTDAARPVVAPAAAETLPPKVTTKLLPCEKGTTLVKGTCVRTEYRIVVRQVPGPGATRIASSSADQAPAPRYAGGNGSGLPAAANSTGQSTGQSSGQSSGDDEVERDHEDDHEEIHQDDHEDAHEGDHEDDHEGDHEGDGDDS